MTGFEAEIIVIIIEKIDILLIWISESCGESLYTMSQIFSLCEGNRVPCDTFVRYNFSFFIFIFITVRPVPYVCIFWICSGD